MNEWMAFWNTKDACKRDMVTLGIEHGRWDKFPVNTNTYDIRERFLVMKTIHVEHAAPGSGYNVYLRITT